MGLTGVLSGNAARHGAGPIDDPRRPVQSKHQELFTLDLARQLEAPGTARLAISEFLAERCAPQVVEMALMVGNELVTNAIQHTSGGCNLTVRFSGGSVVVEVHDNDLAMIDRSHLDGDLLGRGLGMVQSMTTRWGIERHPDGGKVVWAEIDVSC
jgi:anti-sigma regulatory factor (Ser/Thr protein kinase)